MTTHTGGVICNITISADGYSAGLDQTEERPFGDDGRRRVGRQAARLVRPKLLVRRIAPVFLTLVVGVV